MEKYKRLRESRAEFIFIQKYSISLEMSTKQLVALGLCVLFMGINLPMVPEPVSTATYSILIIPSLCASGKNKSN